MNTTTDNRRTDEAMIEYVEWLQLSVAVQDAYDRWRHGPRHQPLAHRRRLLPQTHILLWVTAARRIFVAWKARRLNEPAHRRGTGVADRAHR